MRNSPTLKEAQRLIIDLARPRPAEEISLDNGLGRVTAENLKARLPVPSFAHSTRDGYAVKGRDLKQASGAAPIALKITGEIPAGCTEIPTLAGGTTLRIMTGAAIPPGSDLVLAQEDVERHNDSIIVKQNPPIGTHIRGKGSGFAGGKMIVRKGTALTPDHLALLATAGIDRIAVHQKPAVAVICTGNELVSRRQPPRTGQVISSNLLLLDGLIKTGGGVSESLTTAPDRTEVIAEKLDLLIAERFPLIITTGGMGPGKFDLMAEVFSRLGIKIIYESLKVRPGRATMLGVLAESLVFALPGPPPAVKLLFHELVRPALLKTGGVKGPFNKMLRAELAETINLRSSRSLLLKDGVYFSKGGRLLVGSGKTATPNCVLLLPPRRKLLNKGELVTIHPTTGAF
jgi:molybdopterin molybdotransferase